jgi:uridine kinase
MHVQAPRSEVQDVAPLDAGPSSRRALVLVAPPAIVAALPVVWYVGSPVFLGQAVNEVAPALGTAAQILVHVLPSAPGASSSTPPALDRAQSPAVAGPGAAPTLAPVVRAITEQRRDIPPRRSVLVGITGIDGSGKGYIAGQLEAALHAHGLSVGLIHADHWLNLPSRRFSQRRPAHHFYEHAIRFEELFAQLVLPLRDRRSPQLEADIAEETATSFHRHTYVFRDLDVVVLEGIFLLKRASRGHFDLGVWVDCSFETALGRAIGRAQEGLPPAATIRAYRTIYFPAQRIHFRQDRPRVAASALLVNDPRLAAARQATDL